MVIREVLHCPECENDLEQLKQCASLIDDPKVKRKYEKRAKRVFRTDSSLTQHMDKVHRKPNDDESPTHCLKCGKKLSWKETQFCPECQKKIDEEMEQGFKEDMEAVNAEHELNQEEEETEDAHQAVDDAYNARFKDSRGRSIFK